MVLQWEGLIVSKKTGLKRSHSSRMYIPMEFNYSDSQMVSDVHPTNAVHFEASLSKSLNRRKKIAKDTYPEQKGKS